jgi:fission 1 protein
MGSNLPYAADAESPLKPAELQVLRAQYEKEGDYVGIQTKFNYAWVCRLLLLSLLNQLIR